MVDLRLLIPFIMGGTDFVGRHHGIVQNVYPLPNDEEEQVRLDEQHFAMSIVMGGNILVKLRRPRKILDVGTGSGTFPEILSVPSSPPLVPSYFAVPVLPH